MIEKLKNNKDIGKKMYRFIDLDHRKNRTNEEELEYIHLKYELEEELGITIQRVENEA